MHEPATSHGVLDRFALEWLGEMLRGRYHLPATLPSRVYDLVMKLDRPRNQGSSIAPDTDDLSATSKESQYRRPMSSACMRPSRACARSRCRPRVHHMRSASLPETVLLLVRGVAPHMRDQAAGPIW
jgi:hypothetical protein